MAVKVNRSDLYYRYTKKAESGDNNQLIWLDSKMFDRDVEYEVINMIEAVLADSTDRKAIRRVEDAIKELPSDIRSRKEVYKWITVEIGWSFS